MASPRCVWEACVEILPGVLCFLYWFPLLDAKGRGQGGLVQLLRMHGSFRSSLVTSCRCLAWFFAGSCLSPRLSCNPAGQAHCGGHHEQRHHHQHSCQLAICLQCECKCNPHQHQSTPSSNESTCTSIQGWFDHARVRSFPFLRTSSNCLRWEVSFASVDLT